VQSTPGRLDEIETRLALIERLKKKYGASVDEVLAYGADCRRQADELGDPEERERALRRRAGRRAPDVPGGRLPPVARASRGGGLVREARAGRAQAAGDGEDALPGPLHSGPAVGGRRVAGGWTERGLEQAEFLLSPNPGEELRPLARIASGGELSAHPARLKSVASLDATGADAGVRRGRRGHRRRVAEVVGRKLKAIAGAHQVLCVTHLPQSRVAGRPPLRGPKRVERGRTLTEVRTLSANERIEEVARMLGGETVSDAARRHARELVKQSVRE
jgi:DNA repair protein RecN (Recombination protein N)